MKNHFITHSVGICCKMVAVLVGLLVLTSAKAGQLRDAAWPMLQRLNGEIAKLQNTDKSSADYGAIMCPRCGMYHTRAGEAIFPLAYEYSQTGDKRRLNQSLILADWLIRQQEDTGAWIETPSTWKGTTTDQLMMMLITYPIVEKSLKKADRQRWLACMEKAADWLEENVNMRNQVMNYPASTAGTLAQAYRLIGKDSYREKARELAHLVTAKMNCEWFIEGESDYERDNRHGVDIGYNMDMSIWGLARYAMLMDDEVVLEAARRSVGSHFSFVYPDGMLEASMGVRSNKWSIFGSGTSDGCAVMFAMLSEGHPEYITAAVRNIEVVSRCFTANGLLGNGYNYDKVSDKSPCIYPTFTKAKSLAMAMSWVVADTEGLSPLPCDGDVNYFHHTLGTAIVRKGDFQGTVTAYNFKSKKMDKSNNMFRPTGGTMSALWVDGYGLLQASSQTEYYRWEQMHFLVMEDGILPLTPRMEYRKDSLYYTNLFDYDATVSIDTTHAESTHVICTGTLRDRQQYRGGAMFRTTYTWDKDSFSKTYEVIHQTNGVPVRIVEPLICDESTTIRQVDDHAVEFSRGRKTIRIVCLDHRLTLDFEAARMYKQPFPALRAVPLVIVSEFGDCRRDTVRLVYQKQ
ncbi:MAG: hypothetical protein Q4E55_04685 [Bacteroidales bacterium]|nr:hypothetical protein [Bacteroidales bacterium]